MVTFPQLRSLLVLGVALFLSVSAPQDVWAARVNVIRVDGVISPGTSGYIVSAIKQAEKDGAEALVIELDTPGGFDTSMRDIIKEMLASPVPIIVYVSPSGARAASAGAFITIAAHIAAMAPGTNIGAATPVALGDEMGKAMERMAVNDAAAYMRTIAERRGRNAKWAEEAVRKASSATEKEALQLGIIDLVAPKLEDLLKTVDGRKVETAKGEVVLHTKDATVERGEMNFRDQILKIISDPTIAYILLLLGLAGLYFELSNPGSLLPGILGAIFLILAFWAFQTLPINYAGLLLIGLAVLLFILEVKVASHGLLTLGGIASFILGSLLLVQSPAPFLRISLGAIVGASAATAGFFILVAGLGLKAQKRPSPIGWESLVGETAVVRTKVSPEGQVFLKGERWNAYCEEGAEPGELVKVVAVEGLKLKVARLQKPSLSEPTSAERA
ncbi:MAG: nodulation protein NfeD [candidate division NC10 bacterium]|nr:nodulation protein NfeD [candidate division NC10 bacterium]